MRILVFIITVLSICRMTAQTDGANIYDNSNDNSLCTKIDLSIEHYKLMSISYVSNNNWPLFTNMLIETQVDSISVELTNIHTFINSIFKHAMYLNSYENAPFTNIINIFGYSENLLKEFEIYWYNCKSKLWETSSQQQYNIKLTDGSIANLTICEVEGSFYWSHDKNRLAVLNRDLGLEYDLCKTATMIGLISCKTCTPIIFKE